MKFRNRPTTEFRRGEIPVGQRCALDPRAARQRHVRGYVPPIPPTPGEAAPGPAQARLFCGFSFPRLTGEHDRALSSTLPDKLLSVEHFANFG